jgi:hypothetical protein
MAKKQKISDKLQAKFDKPQFRIGDAVFFSWLGQKQYGYVIRIKKTTWGIQYNVESASGTKYPCGIQIQGQKTHYNTGFIFLEDTRTIGTEELEKRIQTAKNTPRTATVFVNPTRPTHESGDDNSTGNPDDRNDSIKNTKTRTKRSSKSNAVSSSPGRNGTDNSKQRKASRNTELDAAIAKQKSFLDFTTPVKKD